MVNCGERVASFSIEGSQTGDCLVRAGILSCKRGRTFELWKRAFQKMRLSGIRTPHHEIQTGTVTVVSIHGNRYQEKNGRFN
ncbi:hypothetical protein C4D60_Mb04t07000 [Musa balbisiana]|uniref:Uncharacterized protein n=1 Tax=Musa balbisiana TaxID=52838 RepID=A0A4V4H9K4_MUSBA|nr:hypothetical protein C4D60_Mb04t07000 [Musa balbisiana]